MALTDNTKNMTIDVNDGWVLLPASIFTNRGGYNLEYVLYDGVPPETINGERFYGHLLKPEMGQSRSELTGNGSLYVRSTQRTTKIAYNE